MKVVVIHLILILKKKTTRHNKEQISSKRKELKRHSLIILVIQQLSTDSQVTIIMEDSGKMLMREKFQVILLKMRTINMSMDIQQRYLRTMLWRVCLKTVGLINISPFQKSRLNSFQEKLFKLIWARKEKRLTIT